MFIIDVSKSDRFVEARSELQSILDNESISKCPIAILCNKIDNFGALNEQQVKDFFQLNGLTTGKVRTKSKCKEITNCSQIILTFKPKPLEGNEEIRPLEVFMCSFTNRQGYGDAFRWLSQYF